jgi:formylglycine-generating enzyme required for sulfatase activity
MSLLEGDTKYTTSLPGSLAGVPILCVLCSELLLAASSPDYYVRKPTWQETMLASREALVGRESTRAAARGFQGYTSGVIRGGEPAIHISVPVAGEKNLFLYVTGVPDPVGGAGTWAEAQLIGRDGAATRASRLPGLAVLEGRHAIDVNLKSGVSGPLAIAGRTFSHGIHVYADSKVRLPLEGKFVRFEAWIGIDDWVGRRGNVRFEVLGAAGAARQGLWEIVRRDFIEGEPRRQMRWEYEDQIWAADWTPGDYGVLARRYASAARRVGPLADQADRLVAGACDKDTLNRVRDLYYRSRKLDDSLRRASSLNLRALRMAIDDLTRTFGPGYAQGPQFKARLELLDKVLHAASALGDEENIASLVEHFDQLHREALLANPLLDFDRLLVVRREPHCDARRPMDTGYGMGEYLGLPRQSSKCAPGIEEPENWDNEIAVLQPVRPEGRLNTLYKPDGRRDILDVDLHWDADRMLFSMPGTLKKWQVFEIGTDGRGLRQVTPGDQPDVHSYDPCYLPNGKIAFISTAPLQGVPCNAGVIVGMMYLMDADGKNIRQVCFEQDHDHCPTVLHDGRVLYLRWDYTDTPHVWNRVLFAMNPDGTGQAEHYGSNSYWPNAIFYARPVPGHSTKVVGIVTGHHVGRVGELVIFDPAKGRRETDGVVQRIPGYGQKVEPIIEDKLTEHSWPKFLHPWPLSEKYFLVSCKPTPNALWGIYLVDVFDNMVLIKEMEGQALLEPIPLKKTPRPPILPERTRPERNHGVVYMADVYQGPAMAGIPRGTVKSLRVFSYHFGYQQIAGIDHRVGTDGPWEVKRILGTVPVESDGSALFRIPAKTPVSVQPLDAEGKAVQLMRSWMTAMPGETLSCVGCHDPRNSTPASKNTIAARRAPRAVKPWYGPARNFSFRAEVQPMLERYCVDCHKEGSRVQSRESRVEGREPGNRSVRPPALDFRSDQGTYIAWRGGDPQPRVVQGPVEKLVGRYGGIFEPSYFALRSLVRVAGLESDLHVLPPMEFHADSSELVQMLKKGHYGVRLDSEAWDRLYTWIDLNAPCHGTWGEFVRIGGKQRERRCELARLYGGVAEQLETPPELKRPPIEPVIPQPAERPKTTVGRIANPSYPWPFDAGEAGRRQEAAGPISRTMDLGDGVKMELVRIPAGSFVMGDPEGEPDEQPPAAVTIARPFWMARCEVTNRQYARFDPAHESRFEHRGSWIFSEDYLGYALDGPEQPVVRVSWNRAMEFCRWLSQRTGLQCSLPTEAQWEYACRAGTATPFSFGGVDNDFSKFANCADATIRELAYRSWGPKTPDLVPRDARFNDGSLVSASVGSYRPNAWGLFDMHGNLAEWTRTAYSPYPYDEDDGRNASDAAGQKVVRGGSWRDRPARCRSSFRLNYAPYQRVFNVGFRVVAEMSPE